MQTHPTKVTGIFCAGRWIILLCCLLAATPVLAAADEFPLDFTTIRLGDDAQGAVAQTAQADTGTQPAEASPARLPVPLHPQAGRQPVCGGGNPASGADCAG